jgi:hypothetical protein
LFTIKIELSSLLVNMKREAQAASSIALRDAMWNWIQVFPTEYVDTLVSNKRLDVSAERIFDMLYGLTEGTSKRTFWPTLAVLFASSPERLKQATAESTGSRHLSRSRKVCLCAVFLQLHCADAPFFADQLLGASHERSWVWFQGR